jgi:hypothetical protein
MRERKRERGIITKLLYWYWRGMKRHVSGYSMRAVFLTSRVAGSVGKMCGRQVLFYACI